MSENEQVVRTLRTFIRELEKQNRLQVATIIVCLVAIAAAVADLLHNACP